VLALRAETVHRIPCDGLVELRAGFALAFALPPRRRLAARALRQHARRLLRSRFAEEQAMSSTTAISPVESARPAAAIAGTMSGDCSAAWASLWNKRWLPAQPHDARTDSAPCAAHSAAHGLADASENEADQARLSLIYIPWASGSHCAGEPKAFRPQRYAGERRSVEVYTGDAQATVPAR
jgi:hypothetical protein